MWPIITGTNLVHGLFIDLYEVDEEFHPVMSGACGYYVKRSLKPPPI